MTSQLRQLYRQLRYGEAIVVVSGLPRSGTSMAMKMLEAGGLSIVTDGLRAADEDNPKGYYEDERVKDLAKQPDKTWLVSAKGKVIKVISFLLKELPNTHNYKVVFMQRNIEEIIASQNKMLARRGESNESSDERMQELFEHDLFKARYLLKHAPQFDFIDIRYRDVLDDPHGQAERIARFVDRPLDVDSMAGVADKQLYRNRREGA